MSERGAAAKAEAKAWLEYAASQYPDGTIPPDMGGAWLTEISIKTGCQQQTVERLAREMRVWTATQLQVHAARHGGRVEAAEPADLEDLADAGDESE